MCAYDARLLSRSNFLCTFRLFHSFSCSFKPNRIKITEGSELGDFSRNESGATVIDDWHRKRDGLTVLECLHFALYIDGTLFWEDFWLEFPLRRRTFLSLHTLMITVYLITPYRLYNGSPAISEKENSWICLTNVVVSEGLHYAVSSFIIKFSLSFPLADLCHCEEWIDSHCCVNIGFLTWSLGWWHSMVHSLVNEKH